VNSSLYHILWYLKNRPAQGEVFRSVKVKLQNERADFGTLRDLQWQKVKKLISHACETSPYYQTLLKGLGAFPEDFRTWQDFALFPTLTKEHIRTSIEQIRSAGVNLSHLRKVYSGGSTGVPTMVYHSDEMTHWFRAQHIIQLSWLALNWGVRTADVWGLNRSNIAYELANQRDAGKPRHQRILLDAFNMTPERMMHFGEVLLKFQPELINGYASSLAELSAYFEKTGIKLKGVRAIVSSAETLRRDQRDLISRVLGAQVFDLYGSTEINWVAMECGEHSGLHIFEDSRLVEAHQIPQTDGLCSLVITDFENLACPLIRYDTGDMGLISEAPCACGRSFRRIVSLDGRVSDMFRLPNGKIFHGEYFTHLLYDHGNAIKKFQVHQVALNEIVVNLVAVDNVDSDTRARVVESLVPAFTRTTGNEVKFSFSFVEDIPNESSGKYRFTKSDVIGN
jgi:phenylacetate-CoA ligase